jgi:hypothetical protein
MNNLFEGSVWDGITEEGKNLIANLLRIEPKKRITA